MSPSPLSQEPRRPMRRLFGDLAPYRGRLALATGASVANKILDVCPVSQMVVTFSEAGSTMRTVLHPLLKSSDVQRR